MTQVEDGRLLILDAATVASALSQHDWIAVAEQSLRDTSSGAAVQGVRRILPLPDNQDRGRVLSMMFGASRQQRYFGAKVIAVFPDNFHRGLGSHRGAVLLFDAENGALAAVLHGGEITASRTAAASAVATRTLARQHSRVLAILGYGEQACRHIDSMMAVRPIDTIRCWGRDVTKATAFAEKISASRSIRTVAVPSVAEAVCGADIVCTTTAAKDPILSGAMLEPGMHLNIVGSSTADYREIDSAAVARSSIWVDYRAMTEVSAGEYLRALEDGVIAPKHLIGEIGATLNGDVRSRANDQEITMFKSLGMPAEDIYAAQRIYEVALAADLGARAPFEGNAAAPS